MFPDGVGILGRRGQGNAEALALSAYATVSSDGSGPSRAESPCSNPNNHYRWFSVRDSRRPGNASRVPQPSMSSAAATGAKATRRLQYMVHHGLGVSHGSSSDSPAANLLHWQEGGGIIRSGRGTQRNSAHFAHMTVRRRGGRGVVGQSTKQHRQTPTTRRKVLAVLLAGDVLKPSNLLNFNGGASGRNRTSDQGLMSPLLYR